MTTAEQTVRRLRRPYKTTRVVVPANAERPYALAIVDAAPTLKRLRAIQRAYVQAVQQVHDDEVDEENPSPLPTLPATLTADTLASWYDRLGPRIEDVELKLMVPALEALQRLHAELDTLQIHTPDGRVRLQAIADCLVLYAPIQSLLRPTLTRKMRQRIAGRRPRSKTELLREFIRLHPKPADVVPYAWSRTLANRYHASANKDAALCALPLDVLADRFRRQLSPRRARAAKNRGAS